MGSSSSKAAKASAAAARPAAASAPAAVGGRVRPDGRNIGIDGQPTIQASSSKSQGASAPVARSSDDAAILEDARDPQLDRRLSQIGAVSVPHPSRANRGGIIATYQQRERLRQQQGDAPPGSAHGRLTAGNLLALLENRKSAQSAEEATQLAREFGMDAFVVEKLATRVTSPTLVVPLAQEDAKAGLHDTVWVEAEFPGAGKRIART